jgi:hypothetical protein
MPLRRKPKRLPGDNRLLRHAFVKQQSDDFERFFGHPLTNPDQLDAFATRLAEELDLNSFGETYRAWLTEKGIDPDTGRMTMAGLAFFEELVAQDNERHRNRRAA